MKNQLKEKRKKAGLSQYQLSRLAGISQATISHIEIGNYIPMVDTALKIAAVLGVAVEELFILPDLPEKYIPIEIYTDIRRQAYGKF